MCISCIYLFTHKSHVQRNGIEYIVQLKNSNNNNNNRETIHSHTSNVAYILSVESIIFVSLNSLFFSFFPHVLHSLPIRWCSSLFYPSFPWSLSFESIKMSRCLHCKYVEIERFKTWFYHLNIVWAWKQIVVQYAFIDATFVNL